MGSPSRQFVSDATRTVYLTLPHYVPRIMCLARNEERLARNEEGCIRRAGKRNGFAAGRFRPSGYNPVELSRFAGASAFGISIARRLAPDGSSPTLSPPERFRPVFTSRLLVHLPSLSASDFSVSSAFPASAQGTLRPALTTVVCEPRVIASFPPAYELSKLTHRPASS